MEQISALKRAVLLSDANAYEPDGLWWLMMALNCHKSNVVQRSVQRVENNDKLEGKKKSKSTCLIYFGFVWPRFMLFSVYAVVYAW